jgi:hypothetical protein
MLAPPAFPVRTGSESRPRHGRRGRSPQGRVYGVFRGPSGSGTAGGATNESSDAFTRNASRLRARSLRERAVTPKLHPAHRDRLREWPFEAGATIGPNPPELVPTPRGPCASPEDELQRGCPDGVTTDGGVGRRNPSPCALNFSMVVFISAGRPARASTGVPSVCSSSSASSSRRRVVFRHPKQQSTRHRRR